MKLINHHKNNYTYDDTHDGSVMNGTITMSQDEFDDAIKFLRGEYQRAIKRVETYRRDALSHVFNWTLKHHADKKRICLGICATELISNFYGLERYKEQNYVIKIL